MSKVLIIEDEESIVSMLEYALKKEGYKVDAAYDGYEASDIIPAYKPDLILLDIMLPNKDGYQICREFSQDYPIIMLTAKDDITDKIAGIEMGADDYITKPFDIREVIVRIKAVLRRKEKYNNRVLKIDELTIYSEQRRVVLNKDEISLTPIEYKLLVLMVKNLNKVYSREELLDRVWGYDYVAETRSVDIQIQRLRKKLGDWAEHIKTIYGTGYQIIGEYSDENTE